MPDTILKRWNGSAFEELYPKTTVGQISASGTASSSTFLRGDGQWQIPATQSHTHSAADITSGTLTVGRGGTGTTSFTSGNLLVGNGSSAFSSVAPADSTVLSVLSSSGVAPALEREVYWGTRYIHLGVTTVAGANTNRTISFTSGMRNFILQLHQDSTTGAIIARLPLTISNSAGTATVGTVYSLDTSTRTHRVAWSNGSATQIMNVSISYSGTTITVSQSFSFNCAFRLFGF